MGSLQHMHHESNSFYFKKLRFIYYFLNHLIHQVRGNYLKNTSFTFPLALVKFLFNLLVETRANFNICYVLVRVKAHNDCFICEGLEAKKHPHQNFVTTVISITLFSMQAGLIQNLLSWLKIRLFFCFVLTYFLIQLFINICLKVVKLLLLKMEKSSQATFLAPLAIHFLHLMINEQQELYVYNSHLKHSLFSYLYYLSSSKLLALYFLFFLYQLNFQMRQDLHISIQVIDLLIIQGCQVF